MSNNSQPTGTKKLKDHLPHGAQKQIAEKVGLSKQAVSEALNEERAGHPAVVEAVRMLRESGGLEAARVIQELSEPANA